MSSISPDSTTPATDFIIQGLTSAGRPFRPSDWADRLCGIMSRFHPDQVGGFDRHLRYSPYVTPALIEGGAQYWSIIAYMRLSRWRTFSCVTLRVTMICA
jgi:hypothetical protein